MTERVMARTVARRPAILHHAEEISGNVALTWCYYGISPQILQVEASMRAAAALASEFDDGGEPGPRRRC